MSIASDLVEQPGVIAAGEYAYRGDRFSYRGELTEELAQMASIMCRATTMSCSMQAAMINDLDNKTAFYPVQGWTVRGPELTVVVIANVFCMFDNKAGSLNAVLGLMRERIGRISNDLI